MITYVPNFHTQAEADALIEFVRTQPFVRPDNKRNRTSWLRRLSFPGYSPPLNGHHRSSRYSVSGNVDDAPEPYKRLADAITAYQVSQGLPNPCNYLSTIGYLPDDHMNFHQHREDKKREDQTVYVLSLGAVHPVAIRPLGCKDKSQWEIIYPKHGSLYVLPSAYNLTHEHAVLEGNDYSYGGLRIGINSKHIPGDLDTAVIENWLQTNCGTAREIAKNCPGLRDRRVKHIISILEALSADGKVKDTVVPAVNRMGQYTQAGLGTYDAPDANPPIYDQHGGKFYPDACVNVDRTTPFGNHNRHDLKTEQGRAAWRKEVSEKMQDAGFRAQVEALRGKNLLCWCTPQQVAKGWCHALTWLWLANEGDS